MNPSLEEIAALVGSSVGAVQPVPRASDATSPRDAAVLVQYVERFNRRDWEGLRELVRADEVDEYQHCPWVLAAAGEIRRLAAP